MESIAAKFEPGLAPCFSDLPNAPASRVEATFTIVARRGTIGDWAAYFGPADWGAAQVASEGNKLPREAARQVFPNISGPYRD